MSKADTIAAAVAARLAGITKANGYATDLGLYVSRGSLAVDADKLPACTLIEQEDQVESQRIIDRKSGADPIDCHILMPFTIEATSLCDPDKPNIAGHALVADIKRAIFGGDLTWGGLASHTKYLGRTLGPRPEGANLVTATVQIRIGCNEDLANP